MIKRILLFDLETTGFPDRTDSKGKKLDWNEQPLFTDTKKYDTARVVQIGLKSVLYWFDKKVNKHIFFPECEYDLLIKPNGFRIENSHTHHIEHKVAELKGIPFSDAIKTISPLFADASLIVSHNIAFDYNILMSEMYRNQLYGPMCEFKEIPQFCTAIAMTPVMRMKIPYQSQKVQYKTPKLQEMYQWLHRRSVPNMDKLHNALVDTRILYECFKQMLTQKIIKLD